MEDTAKKACEVDVVGPRSPKPMVVRVIADKYKASIGSVMVG